MVSSIERLVKITLHMISNNIVIFALPFSSGIKDFASIWFLALMVRLVDNCFYLAITTVFMLSTSWNTRLLKDGEDHIWW